MAKGRHQKDKLWQIHTELSSSTRSSKNVKLESPNFEHCSLTHERFEPGSEIVADDDGRLYLKSAAEAWSREYTCNPVTGAPLTNWRQVNFSWSENGDMICPLTFKQLVPVLKIVMNKNNGFVYSQNGLKNLPAFRQKILEDPMDCSKLNLKSDLLIIHDPEKSTKEPGVEMTPEFLKKHKRPTTSISKDSEVPADTASTLVKGTGLTKRILAQIDPEGGAFVEAAKKLRREEDDKNQEGYLDPITGERKLVKSKVHTGGVALASLTSTAVEPERQKKFRYLTSREYRVLIYQRMLSRKHVNSELAITLALQESSSSERSNLNMIYYAWKFPELVHQILVNILKKSIKLFQAADEFNDTEKSSSKDCLWFCYDPAFDDVDEEIQTIEKFRGQEPFIQAGSIFRRLDDPNAIGITALGFPRDMTDGSDTLHVVGRVKDPTSVLEMAKRANEFIPRDTVVHANPYIDCEKLAIEEYLAR